MKKYTKPEVEITAFDFEDITMSALNNYASAEVKSKFSNDMAANGGLAVDASGIIEW